MQIRTGRTVSRAYAVAVLLLLLPLPSATEASAASDPASPFPPFLCDKAWCGLVVGGDGEDSVFVTKRGTVRTVGANGNGNGPAVDFVRIVVVDAGGGADLVVNEGSVEGIGEASASHRVPARAEALVTGIDAGTGDDTVRNAGSVVADGSATATTTAAALPPWAHGESRSVAVGIDGGDGDDGVENAMTVTADAEARVRVEAAGSAESALAEAVGISGGSGGDRIANTGTVAASAVADTATAGGADPARKTQIGHNPPPGIVDGSTATAVATALDGSSGDDVVVDSGTTGAAASATAGRTAFELRLHDASLADLSTSSAARAAGIAGGDGDDRVAATGSVSAAASADAGSVVVSGEVEKNVFLDAGVDATASAAAVTGGAGNDVIALTGSAAATAGSSVHDVSVELAYRAWPGNGHETGNRTGQEGETPKPSVAASLASSARSAAIEGGAADDAVTNDGTVVSDADATVSSHAVTVAAEDPLAADLRISAASEATGIDGGEGNDDVANRASIRADGSAGATGLSVTVALDGGEARADLSVRAGSTGIDGGEGDDRVSNTGTVEAASTVGTPGIALAATATDNGSVSARITAEAVAVGIDGGGGDDSVRNDASVRATAGSTAAGGTVSATFPGSASLDAAATVRSTAVGIDGGTGDDTISNTATIAAEASSTVAGTVAVDADGNASVAASVRGEAVSGGLLGGSGDDGIANTGTVVSTATGSSSIEDSSTEVAGIAAGGGGTDASARADGIDGGDGDDAIANRGSVTSTATATAESRWIAALLLGGGTADGTATAVAIAGGISGGDGNDVVTNDNAVAATAAATATVADASFTAYGLAASSTDDSAADADASVTGLDGGTGDDRIESRASVTATATADADARALSATLGGASLVDASGVATALAAGISGGEGNDNVTSAGTVSATAAATATAADASFTALGAAFSSLDNAALLSSATSAGIDGGAGDDRIESRGAVSATATAETDAWGISATLVGASLADAAGEAEARSGGILAGEGNDTVESDGSVTSSATADVDPVNVALTGLGAAGTTDPTRLDNPSRAEARASGIEAGGGTDTVTNRGEVTVSASASVTPVDASVALYGAGGSASTALAGASSTGIDGGEGDDGIRNAGSVRATAASDVTAVGISVVLEGIAASTDRRSETGNRSDATASGIDAGGGNDTVRNDGTVTADATGSVLSVRGSAAFSSYVGSVVVDASSAASGKAEGISAGAGDDLVESGGAVTATAKAEATAVTATVSDGGFGIPLDVLPLLQVDLWEVDRGLKAEAVSTGISAGEGSDNVVSRSAVLSRAEADAVWVDASFRLGGATSVDAPTSANATATGVSGGGGDDVLSALSSVEATAEADTVAVGVALSYKAGKYFPTRASANTEGWAGSYATAIDGGDGADRIGSLGTLTATANSDAVAASVSAVLLPGEYVGKIGGFPLADSSAKALATASGIVAGSGDDTVFATGTISADADALAVPTSVAVAKRGFSATFNPFNLQADSAAWGSATGIDAGGGHDAVTNTATISSTASGRVVSDGVAVTLEGISAVYMGVEAVDNATAVSLGAGNDNLVNRGALAATADSSFWSLNVAVAKKGVAGAVNPVWDGGSLSEANAFGIDAGEGNDHVWNYARIDATATDNTISNGVSAALEGVAATVMTSTLEGRAVAVAGGEGNDGLYNEGDLSAAARTEAWSLNLAGVKSGVAVSADAVWDGGTTAESYAAALDGGAGNDRIVNLGNLRADSLDNTSSYGGTFAYQGFGAAILSSTAEARSAGIAGGEGHDAVATAGATVGAYSAADSDTVSVSLSYQGVAAAADAVWDGGTTAKAHAFGVDGGGGNDNVTVSGGAVTASSTAETDSFGVAGSYQGVAVGVMTSTALSEASAIAGGEGDDSVASSGTVTSTSVANADTTSASITYQGASVSADAVWDGGTTADADAYGIDGGAGNDDVTSEGPVVVTSTAEAQSNGITASFQGVAGVVATSTARSDAAGIAGGTGTDAIRNHGTIETTAGATANGVQVALAYQGVTLAADAVWDGGTTAVSRAAAIDGGDGGGFLGNDNTVSAVATADTTVVGVSAAVEGIGLTVVTSTADASGYGIAGGSGAEAIGNTGAVTASSDADANTVNVSAAGLGVAASADAVWDGGTKALSRAAAIDGGGGNDNVTNGGALTTTATAESDVAGVSGTLAGVGATVLTSTADATGDGISAGDGSDDVRNSASVDVTVTADADTVGVAVAGIGAAAAADSSWDQGTRAYARATGIGGEGGDDSVRNGGAIHAAATADATSDGISVALLGAAATVVSSTAEAGTAAIDGGDGNDFLRNEGELTATATATAEILSLAVTPAGMGAAVDAIWDSGPLARAYATGIEAGGGNDNVANLGSITGDATATADATAVSVTIVGAGFSDATLKADGRSTGLSGGAGDDVLVNLGSISLSARGITDGSSTSVSLAGYGDAKAGTDAKGTASGIDGGEGDDLLANGAGGTIAALAVADADSGAVTVGLAGDAPSGGAPKAAAAATGLDGGGGNDVAENDGRIEATALSTSDGNAVAVELLGYASTDVSPESTATATGIAGGAGNDVLLNTVAGSIAVTAADNTTAGSHPVSIAGQSDTDARIRATATAVGVDGGDGDDLAVNGGRIEATALSRGSAPGASVNIFGVADAQSDTVSVATAAGISGGAGNDNLANLSTGTVTVTAAAAAFSSGAPVNIFGEAEGDASLAATASATAMSGGDGDDSIRNAGTLVAAARAKADATGTSTAIFGDANGTAGATATTNATGIDGGAGDDVIVNTGAIRVAGDPPGFLPSGGTAPYGIDPASVDNASIAWAITSNSTWNLFGEATTGATLSSASTSTGIRGGAGNDAIRNDNTVEVESRSNAAASGNSKGFIGDAQNTADTGATAAAAGIEGNDGDDTIVNGGRIASKAYSGASVTGRADEFIGEPSASASARATATAGGIDAGEGDNEVGNVGTIEATAEARIGTDSVADSDLGKNWSLAVTKAGASADGIRTGDGNDSVTNLGSVSASATTSETAFTTADEDADAKAGNVAYSPVLASAAAVRAGDGTNVVHNDNALSASATATANGHSVAKSHTDTSFSTALAGATAEAAGIRGGSGVDNVVNDGSVAATATAGGDATADYPSGEGHLDRARAVIGGDDNTAVRAVASGIHVDGGTNAVANRGTVTAAANLAVTALGFANTVSTVNYGDAVAGGEVEAAALRGGDGANSAWNGGRLEASATAAATLVKARADEHGTSLVGEDGTFRAVAAGMRFGDGNNVLVNDNAVAATAAASVTGESVASSHTDTAYSVARGGAVSDATAVAAGGGTNRIVNNGSLAASSTASVTVLADYPGGEAHLDSATAQAGGSDFPVLATAAGIRIGNGSGTITNRGSIDVSAAATASATAYSGTYGADTAAIASASAVASASGIEAGDGGNTIENRGTITVHAGSDAAAIAYSSSTWGDENPYATRSAGAEAFGIRTGEGGDTIRNFGTIHAGFRPGGTTWLDGIAIHSGGGADRVFLMEGSRAEGNVDLGAGNDVMTVEGGAVLAGSATGGDGMDRLVLGGSGALAAAPLLFEALAKEGDGTFSVPALATVGRIEALGGTLRIGGDYRFAEDGTLLSRVAPGGSGRIDVEGEATLGGSMEVARSEGAFVDGTTYELVHAGTVAGGFGSVRLPEPTPLLSFSWGQSTDNVTVAVSAKSFASAAGAGPEGAVARSLDALVPTADGDMARAIGSIQALPSSGEIRRAYRSLSPVAHGYATSAAVEASRLYGGSLKVRMAAVRDGALTGPGADAKPVRIAWAGEGAPPFLAGRGDREADLRNGFWLGGFGQSGKRDGEGGYDGFKFTVTGFATGYDRAIGEHLVAGGALGYSLASVHLGNDGGDGSVKGYDAALYGTYFSRRGHLDGSLGWGVERFEDARRVEAGGTVSTARSDHDGDLLSASLSGGLILPAGPWTLEPVASLDYARLSEDGFREDGAGPLGLVVSSRSSDSLVSDAGIRLSRTFPLAGGNATPEAGIAWRHDFRLDDGVVSAAYAGAPGAVFRVAGQTVPRNGAVPRAGFSFVSRGGVKTSLRYEGDFREGYRTNAFVGDLRYDF